LASGAREGQRDLARTTVRAWIAECSREEVLERYAGWHESLPRLFAAADTWYKWALYDRDPIPQWTRGRVTVLGDAAHPRTGRLPGHFPAGGRLGRRRLAAGAGGAERDERGGQQEDRGGVARNEGFDGPVATG
jgi:hypothetical protein